MAVTNLVVIPADDLDKLVGQIHAGVGIEDAGAGIAHEVARNHSVFGVAQDALEFAIGSLLHGVADVFLGGGVLQIHGEVNNRHVEGGNTHRDTGELAIELGNHFAHSLGSASARRNDVARSGTAAAPVLHRGTVHCLLRGSGGVHCGHQAVLNAEGIVEHLGDGSQAVGGARSVRNDGFTGILVGIHAAHKHGSLTAIFTSLAGSRQHHILGTGLQVLLGLVHGQEQTCRFHHIFGTHFVPLQIGGIFLGSHADGVAIDNEQVLFSIHFDGAVELAVHGVIFEHVSHVVNRQQVVDSNHHYVIHIVLLES